MNGMLIAFCVRFAFHSLHTWKVFMKTFSLFLLISLLSGCASLDKMVGLPVNEGNGFDIEHDREIYGGGVHVEYQHPGVLEKDIKKRMANRMASEAELNQALSNVVSGGRFKVHIESLTIDGANTKWYEYVILKDGKEVYREKGRDSIANTPTDYAGGIGFWWNIDLINVYEPIEPPFTFIVISNLTNERDTFVISKPKA